MPARHSTSAPPVFGPAHTTDTIRDAAARQSQLPTTAIPTPGQDEDLATEHAANNAVQCTRSTAHILRHCRNLVQLVDAYAGSGASSTYRLLRDLGDYLNLSIAYVDRATIEAHLERDLSEAEWTATSEQFQALDFDDRIGDTATVRTDWIEDVLHRAGVLGYGYTPDGEMT